VIFLSVLVRAKIKEKFSKIVRARRLEKIVRKLVDSINN